MKERPIIFQGWGVRAIMEDRKTQTRRICKRAIDSVGKVPPFAICLALESGWIAWFGLPNHDIAEFTKKAYRHGFPCPYGVPGDRLWVRETFTLQSDGDGDPPPFSDGRPLQKTGTEEDGFGWLQPHYRATDPEPELACVNLNCEKQDGHCHWAPSIHMPRWASRLLLEITEVRVQRVQDINEEDAKAEGVRDWCSCCAAADVEPCEHPDLCHPRLKNFAGIWDSINAKPKYVKGAGFGGATERFESNVTWANNPWVWALSFKRVTAV